jgi:NADH-quinone oxidoreductase subunit L
MPSPAILLLIATLLPLASFLLLVFMGKRLGKPLAGWVGTAAIFGSFICAMVAMVLWVNAGITKGYKYKTDSGLVLEWGMGQQPIDVSVGWIPAGDGLGQAHHGYLDVGVYVDSLTLVMFAMITLVSTLIHVFSTGYMAEDKRYPRFFMYLGLFCFSMLGLVLGGTLLQLFIFWELVGLCSYLLIGFWYEKKSASNAAIKAFVTNRVGDLGFLVGFGILLYHVGNASLPEVWRILDATKITAGGIEVSAGVWFGPTLLTVMGIGLFCGAMGKSAQFPLHVWLPDAMEGPTPVSALIHAATMVAAGVYLVGRIFPILTPDAKLFIAIIGCVTLTMAALIALAQTDIKKVLAYSTLSQLGYMILAMGVGSWVGGLFHLITHAFFKALLFLGSGSVIHAAHHEQEMPQYGGLMRKIPLTAITFGIAVLVIAGTPYMSAYYSKDMILRHAAAFGYLAQEHGLSRWYWLLFWCPATIAFVTAFYMTRCWMLTFWGRPRNQHLYDHAHETPVLVFPLIVLAGLSVIGGYEWMNIKGLIVSSVGENTEHVRVLQAAMWKVAGESPAVQEAFDGFAMAWPAETPGETGATDADAGETAKALTASQKMHLEGEELMHSTVMWAPWVGIGLGFMVYMRGYAVANRLMKVAPVRWLQTWLYRRMLFDELYNGVLVAATLGLTRICAAIDRYVVDGAVNLVGWGGRKVAWLAGLSDKHLVDGTVDGMAELAQQLGAAVRLPQTGRIRVYVLGLLAAFVLAVTTVAVVIVAR